MQEVMEKTFELIDCLDSSDIICNIDMCKRKIDSNKELKELIQKGKNSEDKYLLMDIKNRLYKYPEYRDYMHYYNELMYIVMDINSRYKKIIGKGSCL